MNGYRSDQYRSLTEFIQERKGLLSILNLILLCPAAASRRGEKGSQQHGWEDTGISAARRVGN